ncbi:MAG: Cell division and transport-associated protein TolR [Geobacteraceae bacterium]|jgi:biopolymer transport protein TolR|nr:Cell division and transport-associated protein TolR [Geobacteraceae bacterium]
MEIGSRDNNNRGAMSQINVTPLVDVMLVLLIIFMVTAPMMQQGVQVNLPKAQAKALNPQEESVVVSIDSSSRIFINSSEIPSGELKPKLSAMFESRTKKEVFLKADRTVPYGEVVKAMAEIKGAGIERLGMITEPSQGK